jgi:hypothetical protein
MVAFESGPVLVAGMSTLHTASRRYESGMVHVLAAEHEVAPARDSSASIYLSETAMQQSA